MSIANPTSKAIASGRFTFLMGLYGENYWRVLKVFDPMALEVGGYRSSIGDGLDVDLHLIERHPYTVDLSLTYLFDRADGIEAQPNCHIRIYTDAQSAEVAMCRIGKRMESILGKFPRQASEVGHRLRINSFLNRWLEYLGEQGHSRFTLKPLQKNIHAIENNG